MLRSLPDLLASKLHSRILAAGSLSHAKQCHAHAAAHGLLPYSVLITSSLILTYSSLGDAPSSLLLFHRSPFTSLSPFLHNSLVRAHTNAGRHSDAFAAYNALFAQFALRPDDHTFPFVLKACADARAADKGREVHGSAFKSGFCGDVFVGNTLLSFYGMCGDVGSAVSLFDEMDERDVVTWNSLVTVFSDNGRWVNSLGCFGGSVRSGLGVNSVGVVSALPACAAVGDVRVARCIHSFVIKDGLDSQVTVGNGFIDVYAKCVDIGSAMQVFDTIDEKNDVSWNSIIGGFVHAGKFADALLMFRAMLASGMKLNSVTVTSLLPALVGLGLFVLGREVHGFSVRTGMNYDIFVTNSLLDMYAKSARVKDASVVFERMESKNAVSWNVMIANFAQNSDELKALELVREMQISGECPNEVTFTSILPACSRISSLKHGKEIHAKSIRKGYCFDLFVSNALVDVYAKCGCLNHARTVFEISQKDEVSYNTLIVGYSQSWQCMPALRLFQEMQLTRLNCDTVSFMGALSACANISAIKQGKEIHGMSVRKEFHNHLIITNSLLDLYTKSGRLDLAKRVFDHIQNKDVASWNTMILGHAMQGELDLVFHLFESMKLDNVDYDSVSFIAVLSACSHNGFVEKGNKYFDQMLSMKIKPTQMHYACMVDLLGRAGLMEQATRLISDMPFEPDSNIWGALLGACRMHGNLEYGRLAAEHLFVLKPEHSGYYVLLSNMYAEAGRWAEACEIRNRMKTRGVKKNAGCSWVESGNIMGAFVVGEKNGSWDA